jgi:putative ABC transport system substrate-binding protein
MRSGIDYMKRREFITLVGGAATAWPLSARAQRTALPVVGFLSARSSKTSGYLVDAFRKGLGETGYIEGQNVAIDYRHAEGQYDQVPVLATDLVSRQVAVIAASDLSGALAGKAATTTIPIVFTIGTDPIKSGLVASLNRPGGNITGVTNLNTELAPKRLELMHELVPTASNLGLLVNPTNLGTKEYLREVEAAAATLGLQLHVLNASTDREFDAAFATLVRLRAGGLVIEADAFFTSRSELLVALSLRHAIPTIYQFREFAAVGGLMSYGGSITNSHYAVGVYTGRILKGEKPADLPVQQSTKVELIINLRTAKVLGITVPLALLTRADEVIE